VLWQCSSDLPIPLKHEGQPCGAGEPLPKV
jgi:hypothetical protein